MHQGFRCEAHPDLKKSQKMEHLHRGSDLAKKKMHVNMYECWYPGACGQDERV